MLLLGDCNHWLKEINDNSIDLIVSDPPYGLEFMGKDWDRVVVPAETWKECYRVLKQGKLAFVMCSPRQDVLARMIINLQDAGFRTNYTSIYWTFASGFPKAANVSKLIDKKFKPKQEYYDLAIYLKQSREQLGLSQKDIAKHFPSITGGLTGCVWNWESASNVPTQAQYNILKEKLGLDDRFDWLIEQETKRYEEAEREIIGKRNNGVSNPNGNTICLSPKSKREIDITKPATEEAKKMEGAYVGFQPKPALEVILCVSKGKTLTWLDEVKIPASYEPDNNVSVSPSRVSDSIQDAPLPTTLYNKNCINHDHHEDDLVYNQGNELSQWLASAQKQMSHFSNVPLDENVLYELQGSRSCCPSCLRFYDALVQWSKVYGQGTAPSLSDVLGYIHDFSQEHKHIPDHQYSGHLSNVDDLSRILQGMASGDSLAYNNDPRNTITKRFPANLLVSDNTLGDYSRYFSLDQWADKTLPFLIVPKASKSERNKGVETLEPVKVNDGRNTPIDNPFQRGETLRTNSHPTVKPLKLMSYLITMGSREGDLVLDPFCGSGTALIAADQLHRKWIGIERNPEYAEIIKKRLMVPLSQLKLNLYVE